jgi:OmcA/MtrC family decaheme c-type cytochrome
MEGHPRVDVDTNGSTNSIPVTSQIAYVSIDEPMSPTPRRAIVSIDKCNNCHGVLSLHGSNRTDNIQVCATCHNPNATDIEDRGDFCVGGGDDGSGCDPAVPADCPGGTCTEFTGEATVDFKVMVHQIHAANTLITGRSLHDYTKTTYPRHERLTNECNACHLEGTYYPVDVTEDFRVATTTDSWVDLEDPEDDLNTTFNAATCGGCHLDFMEPDAVKRAHMVQNGSSFLVGQSIDGNLDPLTVETCTICHGPGKPEDVVEVHKAVGAE